MITWMQRHKKWLVITIWISTIAFVGAGFVGWGSYDYGSKGGAVAVVGEREVSVEEFQREYSSLYDQYANLFGNQFNQEMADKLKLKESAYQMVIQKNLILSYADGLGLTVTNEEVAKQLVQIPAFIKDGKFDKATYIKVLSQNRTKPAIFEAQLKRDLLLQKIESIFKTQANKSEVENLNKLLFSEDDISIKILSQNDVKVDIKDEEIKRYWETNKANYQSQPAVLIEYEKFPLLTQEFSEKEISEYYANFKTDFRKEDGKIKSLEEAKKDVLKALNAKATKKEALKKYLRLKKGEDKFTNKETIEEIKLAFGEQNNKEVKDSVPGDLIKPFLVDNEFVIVKVLNKIAPKPLAFEKAKDQATKDYTRVALGLELETLAKKELENFSGTDIGFVARDSVDKIKGLSKEEALTFLNTLFSSTQKQGKITVGEKVVLYKINDTRLASYDSTKDEAVKTTINNLLNQELMSNLVKNLEKRYEVQSSISFEE